jgi:acetolactate synthase-1/2/3 large subunit
VNGAESLVRTLLGCGVEVCFANPGTSEMHFVAALDRVPGMRCVLGLHENVVTGCADGYWRMAGKPAATLLHCGPGLANGLANLHNARRARSGVVNIVGDQAAYHRPLDPPLTADTEGWARGVSAWVRTTASAATVGTDAAVAVRTARTAPGRIATLVLPADTAWDEGGAVAPALPVPPVPSPDPHAVRNAARTLRDGRNVLVLLGGGALGERAQLLAHRIAAATGCRLLAETFNARVARGRGRLPLERVPYVADLATGVLARVEHLILVGSRPPVGFFAYPGKPGLHYPPTAEVHVLARPEHDPEAALLALADELGAPPVPLPDPGARPEPAHGAPTPEGWPGPWRR